MESLKKEGRKIQNHTMYEIEEEYLSLLNEYRKRYMYRIIDIVQQEIRGFPESRIEDWIEEYLISEIKKRWKTPKQSNVFRHRVKF